MRASHVLTFLTLMAVTPASGQQPEPRAKTSRTGVTGERYVEGIVDQIDKNGMTLVEVLKSGEVREHKLVPTDVLREGEVSRFAGARFSYLWSDVKRGDKLEVAMNTDHIDKLTYCVNICILRRPKEKLPAWRRLDDDYDKEWSARFQMFNDLDNGEDVSDADIKKLFPSRPETKDYQDRITPAIAGGLNKEWQAKLDAIRAKKKDEKQPDLKAPPPADKK